MKERREHVNRVADLWITIWEELHGLGERGAHRTMNEKKHISNFVRLYKVKTGVESDGFHPKVSLVMTKDTRGELVEFVETVEQSGKMAATSMHDDVLLDSEECHE